MKGLWCAAVAVVWVAGDSAGLEQTNSPPSLDEVVAAFERTVSDENLDAESKIGKLRVEAVGRLQAIQDRLCRDAKLDEAPAVREQIRAFQGVNWRASVADLPPDAAEIAKAYQNDVAAVERTLARRIEVAGQGAAERLQPTLDRLCRDANLDEAIAVRDAMRRLRGEVTAEVKPDPGYLQADASQIGQVWYFEVVGANTGSIYGTDVYTSDSSLTAAAVHTGALELGEKGVVRVTILPGQSNYPPSTRHGITSSSWGGWGVSLKAERARGVFRAAGASTVAEVKVIDVPAISPPVSPAKIDSAPEPVPPPKF